MRRLKTAARWFSRAPSRTVHRFEAEARSDVAALTVHGQRAQVALRVTLGVLVAVALAHVLHLDMPVWAAISVVRVFQNDRTATVRRGLERVAGTVGGCAVAYAILRISGAHAWVYVATGVACALSVYAQAVTRYSYAFVLVGFTVPLMTYHAVVSPEPITTVILMRGMEVMVGVCVAWALDFLTSPARPKAPPKPLYAGMDAIFLGHALTVGIAVTLVPVVWAALHLPGFEQTPITAFIVVGAAREGIGWKSLNRCVGCALGAAVGFIGVLTLDGSLLTWALFVFAALFVFTQIGFGGSVVAYTGIQASIAFLLVVVQEPIPHLDLAAGLGRMWGVMGGIAMVMLVGLATWPIRRRIAERLEPQAAHEAAH